MKTSTRWLFALLLLLKLGSAQAHHAYAADFAEDDYGEVSGTVVEVFFINPHSQYVVEVAGPDGELVEWAVIMQNLQTMAAVGWDREAVKVGDKVTIFGRLGRNGKPMIWPQTVTLESGQVLDMGVGGPLK